VGPPQSLWQMLLMGARCHREVCMNSGLLDTADPERSPTAVLNWDACRRVTRAVTLTTELRGRTAQ